VNFPLYSKATDEADLPSRFLHTRKRSVSLISNLNAEDVVVQSMPDASPAKWHLAHTTWFFETFLLAPHLPGYQVYDEHYAYLFNSYYESLGPRQPRPQRGLLTRPTLDEVRAYRQHVDLAMQELLQQNDVTQFEALIQLGMAHEEQHQELLLMDILHLFNQSPLKPVYDRQWPLMPSGRRGQYHTISAGLVNTGNGNSDFCFDNESPRHAVWLMPFDIADRLVTNGEWLAFMDDGGYRRPELWLADGWTSLQEHGWNSPGYWQEGPHGWSQMTLSGMHPVDHGAPVTHISYYEASAYAGWALARLPSESEWELAAESGLMDQLYDTVWQWTMSPYGPYPGFRAQAGAIGEYNGKFMANQMVLRGGASVTPIGHSRSTYRNFYRLDQRWMFSGLRLARDKVVKAVDAAHEEFSADVVAGLSLNQKSLSPKYFYDGAGSALFEEICLLPEYYLTRTESALLKKIAPMLAGLIPENAALVEFGSGASDKTRLVLNAVPQITTYVPIDISVEALHGASERLAADYLSLRILPLVGDFTTQLTLPPEVESLPKAGFFPGSTIGNFSPQQCKEFLTYTRTMLGENSMLIVGADVVKDEATLLAAYDDEAGVTARFNKNLLVRINRELGGNFDPELFRHEARWNTECNRMEMHLVSVANQIVHAAGRAFAFKAGESLHTENSYKFTSASIAAVALQGGWMLAHQWISNDPEFALFLLKAVPLAT